MSAMEAFRNSNAWDPTYQLPLCPGANNPWIYGAYALKLMRENGLGALEEMKLVEKFIAHARECQVEPGLFNRWPNGQGGGTSHDEIMGLAYISAELAKEILAYLEKTDGVYVNIEEDKKTYPDWSVRFNVYRMIWLRPFLKARSGYGLNLVTQTVLSFHLLYDAWKTKSAEQGIHDQGGRLLIWIMLEAINKLSLAGAAGEIWKRRMNSLGLSPKQMLKIEPGDFPVYTAYAKDSF